LSNYQFVILMVLTLMSISTQNKQHYNISPYPFLLHVLHLGYSFD